MRGIGEICRRRQALGRFLAIKRSDSLSRLHLERYRRGDLQDEIDGKLSAGLEEDIQVRFQQQDQEFLRRKEAGLLTPQWRRYGEGRLIIIFQAPTRAQNGQTSLPRQPV